MFRFIPKMLINENNIHSRYIHVLFLSYDYYNARNNKNNMNMEYIVNSMQQNKMKCRSTKQVLNNLSWNSKSPGCNTMKCHGPSKPQALLTSTWPVSTFKNIIQETRTASLPHQHHDPLLPWHFWNQLNHQIIFKQN